MSILPYHLLINQKLRERAIRHNLSDFILRATLFPDNVSIVIVIIAIISQWIVVVPMIIRGCLVDILIMLDVKVVLEIFASIDLRIHKLLLLFFLQNLPRN